MNVKNFIDLHVHIGPEILPRKFTVGSIAKLETGRIAGLALKSHFYPTIPMIKALDGISTNLLLIGTLTLNNYVGGLNPDAVYASAKLSSLPIIVWFPTISAEQFLKESEYEIPLEWTGNKFTSRKSSTIKGIKVLDDDNKLTIETKKVLMAIKENDCILATGHLSWQEVRTLVLEATKMGIKQIIITHPIYQRIGMPIQIQKELVEIEGVYIEHNYAMYLIDKIPIKTIVDQIKSVGADNCIISSDMGQINSPSPSEGLRRFTELLEENGLTKEEIVTMGEVNPRKLLGIIKNYKKEENIGGNK